VKWELSIEQVDDETQEWLVSGGTDIGDGWMAWVDLDLVEGELVVIGVRYVPTTPTPAPFTTETLRLFGLGEMYRAMRDDLRTGRAKKIVPPEWMEAGTRHLPRPGGAGRSDVEYLRWAVRYVRAMEAAPGRPIAHLHELYGNSPASIRALVNKARRRGLLPKLDKTDGKASGALTAKAKRLLRNPSVAQLLDEEG
jgi:hypothetical protein